MEVGVDTLDKGRFSSASHADGDNRNRFLFRF